MGTSSSYSGSSGKPGKDLRNELEGWLDGIDGPPPSDAPDGGQSEQELPAMPTSVFSPVLFIPKAGRGTGAGTGGGGGGSGGVDGSSGGSGRGRTTGRTIAGYASTAGRAAAAARAFRDGDRDALQELGLDFDKLNALPNRFEMVREIVESVCSTQTESSIDSEEQRAIAAQVAEWVLNPETNVTTPESADVAREAIALILCQVYLTEANAQIDKRADKVDRGKFEARVAETARTLASTVELPASGARAVDISKVIRTKIADLKKIHPLKKST